MKSLAANLLVILLPLFVAAFAWWFIADWWHGRKIGGI